MSFPSPNDHYAKIIASPLIPSGQEAPAVGTDESSPPGPRSQPHSQPSGTTPLTQDEHNISFPHRPQPPRTSRPLARAGSGQALDLGRYLAFLSQITMSDFDLTLPVLAGHFISFLSSSPGQVTANVVWMKFNQPMHSIGIGIFITRSNRCQLTEHGGLSLDQAKSGSRLVRFEVTQAPSSCKEPLHLEHPPDHFLKEPLPGVFATLPSPCYAVFPLASSIDLTSSLLNDRKNT
ncbi:uncharacterized protein CLUP02_10958 [Colletotrichum lupini]|uniref:Uncharacterized protein n=1 Tax=Colletotrichum lupini TaxID=145971 RepID=A0A9Q8WK18_9PEZI|nr:uncharacterized protein CLUP02_10958 [Colletotrichum lupini]UQC85460.1 hypothetical protein CLUP02_10958 [Colletotrichum lupini]